MGLPLGLLCLLRWTIRGTDAESIGQNAEKLQRRIRNLRGFADVMRLKSSDAG
jgi:hypothetical protein